MEHLTAFPKTATANLVAASTRCYLCLWLSAFGFRSREASKAQEPEPEPEPSVCLTQPCRVKVFHNGEHEKETLFTVSPADMEGLDDLGLLLGPKMECVSEGMR